MLKTKSIISILMVIFLSLSIISCTKKQQTILVNASDSLGWQDDLNYNLRVKRLAVDEDEIIVLNDGEPSVFVYDRESKNFLKSFGEDGDGPGEFRSTIGIASYNNRYWVSESSPLKIHSFSHDLQDVNCYNGHFIMWFMKDQNKLYGHGLFNCGVPPILHYKDDKFMSLLVEEEFLEENNLTEKNIDPVYRLNVINGKLFMVYCRQREIFLFDDDFIRVDIKFSEPDLEINKDTIYGRVEKFKNGFLLPVITDLEEETYLTMVHYSFSGEIINYYQINMTDKKMYYLWKGITVWENYVFLYDENTGYIYEYEL